MALGLLQSKPSFRLFCPEFRADPQLVPWQPGAARLGKRMAEVTTGHVEATCSLPLGHDA